MIESFFEGVSAGFLLAFLVGPVFFFLLQTSIEQGVKVAICAALGIVLSDLLFIIFSYFAIESLFDIYFNKRIVEIIGGLVLVIFGLVNIIKKSKVIQQDRSNKTLFRFKAFVNGFTLNTFTPSVLLFWLATVGVALVEFDNKMPNFIAFFAGILICTLSFDVTKSFIASRLRKLITPKILTISNKILGVIMIFSGVVVAVGLR